MIYNFFAVLFLFFMLVTLHNDIKANERLFQSLRLSAAVDYATEGAFLMSLETGDLGLSYQDMRNVIINPDNTLETFKYILALSYDMGISRETIRMLDNYITSAVLAVNDGYYIAELVEDDKENHDGSGGIYVLKWGLKKPYVIRYNGSGQEDPNGHRYVAYSLVSENWVYMEQSGNTLIQDSGDRFIQLIGKRGIFPSRERILAKANELISNDINFVIQERNKIYDRIGNRDFVYLPSSVTSSGINEVSRPSLLVTLAGVDFAGPEKLEAHSVGGFTIADKVRVIAFRENGQKYYAYEGQIPPNAPIVIDRFFNTIDEAALQGYHPHVRYLANPKRSR